MMAAARLDLDVDGIGAAGRCRPRKKGCKMPSGGKRSGAWKPEQDDTHRGTSHYEGLADQTRAT
jgi:hypothetical protein